MLPNWAVDITKTRRIHDPDIDGLWRCAVGPTDHPGIARRRGGAVALLCASIQTIVTDPQIQAGRDNSGSTTENG